MNDRFEFDESSANETYLSNAAEAAFEEQLRSVSPSPPALNWSQLELRLRQNAGSPSADGSDHDMSSQPLTAKPNHPWRSHVATGLVGMLSGAAAMFLVLSALGWQAEPRLGGEPLAHDITLQERRITPDETEVAANNAVDAEADSMAVRDPTEERGMASGESPRGSQRDWRHQFQRDRLDSIVQSILDGDAGFPPLTVGYGIVGVEPGTRGWPEPRGPKREISVPRIPRPESDRETSRTASELLREYLEDVNAGSRFSTTM